MPGGTTFIKIDDTDGNFFFTKSQIEKTRKRYFVDSSPQGSYTEISSSVVDLLNRPPNRVRTIDERSQAYLSSGTLDIRRYGVEITDFKHWMAGTIKISAGSEGHLVEPVCLGVEDPSIFGPDIYHDKSRFDPVDFIESQVSDFDSFLLNSYPIVVSDNQVHDAYRTNGIIEPLSIRPEVSFLSVDIPFESRGLKGSIDDGNHNFRLSSDAILGVDYYEPEKLNAAYFLDAADELRVTVDGNSTGLSLPYFNNGSNCISPFDDAVRPRGISLSSTYTEDMINALTAMSQSTSFYISEKQRSAAAGFVYDNTNPQGTDSIAFGGMLY